MYYQIKVKELIFFFSFVIKEIYNKLEDHLPTSISESVSYGLEPAIFEALVQRIVT